MPPTIEQLTHRELTVGTQFSFNIAITGNPTQVTVEGLLEGYVYNYLNGTLTISGTPDLKGTNKQWDIKATNSTGTTEITLLYSVFVPTPQINLTDVEEPILYFGAENDIDIPILNKPSKVTVDGLLTGLIYSISTNGVKIGGAVDRNADYTVDADDFGLFASSVVGLENRIGSDTKTLAYTLRTGTLPSAPRSMRAITHHSRIELQWTVPSTIGIPPLTHYEFRYKRTIESSYSSWQSTGGTTTSHNIYSLVNGVRYNVQVRAVCPVGNGSVASIIGQTGTLPSPPRSLLSTSGDGRVTINWSVPYDLGIPALTHYEYRYKTTSSSNYNSWRSTGSTSTSHTISSLTNGTMYDVQLRSVNVVGGSQTASIVVQPGTLASAPRSLSSTTGDGRITINWVVPSDRGIPPLTHYEYRYKRTTDSNYNSWRSTGSASTSHAITSLSNGVMYNIQLRAVNIVGGGATASITAQTGTVPIITRFSSSYASNVGSFFNSNVASYSGIPTPGVTVFNLPSGLNYSASGGIVRISGTPNVQITRVVTLRAQNVVGSRSTTITFFVNPRFAAPRITNARNRSYPYGGNVNFRLTATGYPPPTFSYTVSQTITGLLFYTDGLITGRPSVGGIFTITATATNSINTHTVSFTISFGTAASFVGNLTNITTNLGVNYGTGAGLIGMSGDPLPTLQAAFGFPVGIVVFAIHSSLLGIRGTVSSVGNHSCVVTIRNPIRSVTQSFIWTVRNPAPVWTRSTYTRTYDTGQSGQATTGFIINAFYLGSICTGEDTSIGTQGFTISARSPSGVTVTRRARLETDANGVIIVFNGTAFRGSRYTVTIRAWNNAGGTNAIFTLNFT